MRNAICIATRYAALRKQFGREEGEEVAILKYPTTQIKILPALAEHFAYRFASLDMINRWCEVMVNKSYNNYRIIYLILRKILLLNFMLFFQ